MLKDKLFSQAAEEKKLASEERGFDLLDRPMLHSAARHPGARPPESNSMFKSELPESCTGEGGSAGQSATSELWEGRGQPSLKETGRAQRHVQGGGEDAAS